MDDPSMDLNNPFWQMPNMLDADFISGNNSSGSDPNLNNFANFNDDDTDNFLPSYQELVEEQAEADLPPSPSTASNSRQSTPSLSNELTGSDSDSTPAKAKGEGAGRGRKDSKRGSGASTPQRDGVTAFLHDGAPSTTANGEVTPGPEPITPMSASKRDPKMLLSPKTATTFDRKALLNAKGAKASHGEPAVIDLENDDDAVDLSNRNIYERVFNVQDRAEATSSKRRKLLHSEHDADEKDKKKQKFEISGGSGVMSEFLRDEKAKEVEGINTAADVASAINVDLTSLSEISTTPGLDDDEDPDAQVVLGKLECDTHPPRAIISNVPHLKPKGVFKFSDRSTKWPPIPVRMQHESHLLVRLIDPLRQRFGTLDAQTAVPIAQLLQSNIDVHFRVTLQPRKRVNNEQPTDGVSQMADLQIKVLAPRRKAKLIGNLFARSKVWLRDTPLLQNEILHNPHDSLTYVKKNKASTFTFGAGGSTGAMLSSTSRTVEEIRSEVANMFDSIIRTEHLPEAEQPTELKTELLSHQKQALFFLLAREEDRIIPKTDGSEAFHLWKPKLDGRGRRTFYNVITGTEMENKPPMLRGGMLADMMGLGKTLSMLSLVVQSADEARRFAKKMAPISQDPRLRRNTRATLLICPLSVVSNWEVQIRDHIKKDALYVHVYHGKDRIDDIEELGDNDVVITSYHTMSAELKRGYEGANSAIFKLNWFRIILDEAHMIRNASTNMAKATCSLSAERRWVVTGTPVQNRLDDLGSLIKFLRIKPFDEKAAFAQYILAPFKTADPEILPKLRLLVDSITLRRLKDNIDLPKRKDLVVRLDFSKEELELYKVFVLDSQNKVQAINNAGKLGGKGYAQILKSIMRLRLICAHGEELLTEEDRRLLDGLTSDKAIDLTDDDDEDGGMVKMSRQQLYDMVELLRQNGDETCVLCGVKIGSKESQDEDSDDEDVRGDTNTLAYMTSCYHLICPKCYPSYDGEIQDKIAEEIQERFDQGEEDPDVTTYHCSICDNGNVNMTNWPVLQSDLEAEAEERARIRADPKLSKQMGFYKGPHTKTRELVKSLKQFEEESMSKPKEAPIKSVVFSTWTSHLDLIQIALTANNITYTRLDGSMSRKKRAAAIEEFNTDPITTVILVTIGAGGLGLNLTAANKVFVMEPQFNPAAEQQAVDRVHRLGQTREVTIHRFIMHNSFEENMLKQQEKKIELADLAVNRNKKMDRGEAARQRLEGLKSLFK